MERIEFNLGFIHSAVYIRRKTLSKSCKGGRRVNNWCDKKFLSQHQHLHRQYLSQVRILNSIHSIGQVPKFCNVLSHMFLPLCFSTII